MYQTIREDGGLRDENENRKMLFTTNTSTYTAENNVVYHHTVNNIMITVHVNDSWNSVRNVCMVRFCAITLALRPGALVVPVTSFEFVVDRPRLCARNRYTYLIYFNSVLVLSCGTVAIHDE